jgi:hypothetical protein
MAGTKTTPLLTLLILLTLLTLLTSLNHSSSNCVTNPTKPALLPSFTNSTNLNLVDSVCCVHEYRLHVCLQYKRNPHSDLPPGAYVCVCV